jgi:hypothetical protein
MNIDLRDPLSTIPNVCPGEANEALVAQRSADGRSTTVSRARCGELL